MKTICIYHSRDLDGWMSAAIVKKWYEDNYSTKSIKDFNEGVYDDILPELVMLGWDYGDEIPDLKDYDKVIICDISFPSDIMINLNTNDRLVWIDHHSSALKQFYAHFKKEESANKFMKGLRSVDYAACELTWQYFFPNEKMPEIVRLLGMYDSFRHKGTDEEQKVLEFQYGARQCISNYEEAYNYLISSLEAPMMAGGSIAVILSNGQAIYQYLCTEAKQDYKKVFTIYFRYDPNIKEHAELGFKKSTMYKFLCINKQRFNPINFGIDYHKDGYDGFACFHYEHDKGYCFSLYNDNGKVDCSIIAKQFGGGGHKGAAGFIVKDLVDAIIS